MTNQLSSPVYGVGFHKCDIDIMNPSNNAKHTKL